jgi:hypothetical protein
MCDPWIAAMRRGDFATAWKVSDRVLAQRNAQEVDCSSWPRHLQFIWRGQPLHDRRVLVRCYHGLGDTIQFIRLLAPLRELAAEVILWAQPSLLSLLATVKGVDRLLPLHDGVPDVPYDVDIELMELPHILRLSIDTIPADIPYIYVRDVGAREPKECPHDARSLRVGIAWQSGEWNSARSIPRSLINRFVAVPNTHWCSLQYDALCPFDAQQMACEDIRTMAERMTQLDLVISADTMTAHLASAIGLPVWLLLQHDCDWRWMSDSAIAKRGLTPWYPTMRLFRQPSPGDWDSVVEQVLAALTTRAQLIRARDIHSAGCTEFSG